MKNLVFIIVASLLLLLSSCICKNRMFEIQLTKNEDLMLTFCSKKDTSFVIDLKAFTNACYNKEKRDLINACGKNIDSISCEIEYSQAVLIDQNNDMRFFTDYYALPMEIKEIPEINCMDDWLVEVNLAKGVPNSIVIDQLYISDLMITEKSSKIMIVYIGRSKNEKNINCASIIESNWIRLR